MKLTASVLAVAVAAFAPALVQAQQAASFNLKTQFESRQAAIGNPYGVRDSVHRIVAADALAQFAGPLESTVRAVASARDDNGGDSNAVLNELSFDRALGPGFVTIGKKVLSWDVGYAFRPLDVVQQQDRRAINAPTLVGVPLIAWELFDASRALTVVLSNPGRRKADQPRDDGALALRLYRRDGEAGRDEYAVLRLSDRNGVEGGLAFSQVEGEAIELHASVLLQQRHDKWINSLRTTPRWQPYAGGGKAMAGLTWTTESKFSVLAEAWLDRTGASLGQRNVLVRASQNWDESELSADVLWMPEDGGRVASIAYDWKHGPWNVSASLRSYGGNANSMARASPVRQLAIVSVNHAL